MYNIFYRQINLNKMYPYKKYFTHYYNYYSFNILISYIYLQKDFLNRKGNQHDEWLCRTNSRIDL